MRVRIEREEERRFPDRGKKIAAKNFHRDAAGEAGQVDLGRLGEAREIDYHDNGFVLISTEERQNLGIIRIKTLERTARKRLEVLAHGDDTPHPPEQPRSV